jgi:hypothetical protein
VRAAIEKNRLLFHWKHLDRPERIAEHLAFLYRYALDAWIGDRRTELEWLALALEQADEILASRAKDTERADGPDFDELCRITSAVGPQ